MSKIEEKYSLKTGQAIALSIILILNILWLVCSTWFGIIMYGKIALTQIVNIVMFAVTVYYVCYSYKKPHSNLMRYLILCSAAFSATRSIISAFEYPIYIAVVSYLIVILKSYMAGRLDHYKQNVIISAVVLVCQCLMSYYLIDLFASFDFAITFVYVVSALGPVILWLAIAASYIVRFKPHKEAGLADK